MADTAKQIDFLLAGYRHPTTDVVLAGGKVETYLDGTSTLSALWTDKDKGGTADNPVILDSSGKAEVFGDNIYKFLIYDSDDVLVETLNGLEYKVKDVVTQFPEGTIIPWVPGYFTDGGNGGYTFVLGTANTIAAANAYLNSSGWYVCNGAALNDSESTIYNGAGRYLPNASTDRFLMGDTSVGGTGGSSTVAHTHTGPEHTHTGPEHNHKWYYLTTDGEVSGSYKSDGSYGDFIATNNDTNSYGIQAVTGVQDYIDVSGAGSWLYTDNGGTGDTGSGGTGETGQPGNDENRPKYLTCFYIIKVK